MLVGFLGNVFNPLRIKLRFLINRQKILALDFAGQSIAQQLAFQPHQTLVQAVQLLNQLLNAGSVQMNRTHQLDQFALDLQIFLLNGAGNALSGQNSLNPLLLNFFQIVIVTGNLGQNLQNRFAQSLFH